jgi:Alpha-L-arabinofuranosidase B, catalytic
MRTSALRFLLTRPNVINTSNSSALLLNRIPSARAAWSVNERVNTSYSGPLFRVRRTDGTEQDIGYTTSLSGLLFSLIPAARAAWSVNDRLNPSYTGPLLRVRRSDGNEQDIGYTTSNVVDQTTIVSFCGTSAGTVSKIYDQSGNGNDIAQATASKQPQIYNGSAVQKEGQNVAALFTAGTYLSRSDACGLTGNPTLTIVDLGNDSTGPSPNRTTFYLGPPSNNNTLWLCKRTSNSILTGTNVGSSTYSYIPNSYNYCILQHTSGGSVSSSTIRRNGAALSQTAAGTAASPNIANTSLLVGNHDTATEHYGALSTLLFLPYTPTTLQLALLENWLETRRLNLPIANQCDTTSLISFCNGTVGTVSQLYDQSGNSYHLTQTTSSAQPQIYSGTAIQKEGTNVAVLFAQGKWLNRADACGFTGCPTLTIAALENNAQGATDYNELICLGPNTGSNYFLLNLNRSLSRFQVTGANGSSQISDAQWSIQSGTLSSYYYAVWQHTNATGLGSTVVRQNSTACTLTTVQASLTTITDTNTTIGGHPSQYWLGTLSTLMLLPYTPTATQLSTLETWLEARRADTTGAYTTTITGSAPALANYVAYGGTSLKELWHSQNGVTITTGTSIDSWKGQLYGVVVTPPTGTKPTTGTDGTKFGSKAIVQTASSGQAYLSTSTSLPSTFYPARTTPCCIFLRARYRELSANPGLFGFRSPSSISTDSELSIYNSGGFRFVTYVTSGALILTSPFDSNVHSFWVWTTGTQLKARIDTTNYTSTVSTTFAGILNEFAFGRENNSYISNCSYAMAMIFDTYPGDTIAAQIQALAEAEFPA